MLSDDDDPSAAVTEEAYAATEQGSVEPSRADEPSQHHVEASEEVMYVAPYRSVAQFETTSVGRRIAPNLPASARRAMPISERGTVGPIDRASVIEQRFSHGIRSPRQKMAAKRAAPPSPLPVEKMFSRRYHAAVRK